MSHACLPGVPTKTGVQTLHMFPAGIEAGGGVVVEVATKLSVIGKLSSRMIWIQQVKHFIIISVFCLTMWRLLMLDVYP